MQFVDKTDIKTSPMNSLIIYESVFGNTALVAKAVCEGLSFHGEAVLLEYRQVKKADIARADLVVAGSPTQKFGAMPGIRKFIGDLPAGSLKGKLATAFDTRIDVKKIDNRFLTLMAGIFGYAATPLASRLRRKGGKPVVPAMGFFVDDTKGPLTAHEADRARAWAGNIMAAR